MAEPARTLPIPRELEDDNPGFPVLQRWIEHPDRRQAAEAENVRLREELARLKDRLS
jgi:hypothetical protein